MLHAKSASTILAGIICLTGCGFVSPPPNIPPQKANAVSLDPTNWYIYYSGDMPPNPVTDVDGAWAFQFPAHGGHVNYIQTPFNANTVLHDVKLTFRVESSAPEYEVLDSTDILPATIHLFFEQQNDDLVNENGRWWAQPSGYNLGSQDNETITYTVPLTPDRWTNVHGRYDAQAFSTALGNVGWIGLTCGGQYFWGHGVAMGSGSAKFVLVSLDVD